MSRFEKEITPQLEHFYSCSFSSYGNLLSQWRGYGDNIAVGFDWNLLRSQNPRMIIDHSGEHSTTSGLDFVQCQYIDPSDEPASEPFVKTVVSAFLDTFNNRKPELHEIQYCALKIGAITTSVKHIGFFEEREYRVVHYFWDAKGIHDLNTNKIEYRFQECSVKRIVIGPCEDQEKKVCSVERLLEGLGEAYNNVEVYRSMIPFIKRYNNKSLSG